MKNEEIIMTENSVSKQETEASKKNDMILDVENLVVRYETEDGIVRALNGVDFKLGYKKTLGLVGETGAGKTTAALAMLRLIPSPPGVMECDKMEIDGKDMLTMEAHDLRKVRGDTISMIFQDPMTSLNPTFTVVDQIAESIELHEKVSKQEAHEKALDMLELVGIPRTRGNEYPHQFSGGMKQRVVIAIALACNPSLLIADEPTTALDVTIQAQVLDLMNKLRDQYGTSLIMITHDLGIVAEICDYVAIMYAGQDVEYADKHELFTNPLHPYTVGLFGCIPDLTIEQDELIPIPGMMPDPTVVHKGCPFAARCPDATDRCFNEKPPVVQVNENHRVRCFKYAEVTD